jgi:hypothetical protein
MRTRRAGACRARRAAYVDPSPYCAWLMLEHELRSEMAHWYQGRGIAGMAEVGGCERVSAVKKQSDALPLAAASRSEYTAAAYAVLAVSQILTKHGQLSWARGKERKNRAS